ncbi:MAG: VRR-NUC domain-containing protein [Caulobacter sp.]|nr:VRR-NUC domain-containing protein [Caulobacter sp.]
MKSPEHDLQMTVTQFLTLALPKGVVWTAVDHGAGKISKVAGGQRKARGVKAGQADYRFVLPPDGRSAEIELKAPGGYQSALQKDWEARVLAAGGLYLVCRSLAEVQGALTAWGVLPRRVA